jgi:hypothetical protein
LETSIPTNSSVKASLLVSAGPALRDTGSLAQATVRARDQITDTTTSLKDGLP